MKLVINNSIHKLLSRLIMTSDVYLAWGNGDGIDDKWTSSPPIIDPRGDHLINEVCRRITTSKYYIVEDPDGEIESNGLRFSISDNPTRTVLLKFRNQASDVPEETIYQIGVYVHTEVNDGIQDKSFLLPNQIKDKGTLLVSSNISPIVRNDATQQERDIIINF